LIDYRGVKISWLGHSSFRLTDAAGKNVYIDPYQVKSNIPAHLILITHEHFDHCSPDDVRKLSAENTIIVTTQMVKEKLRGILARFLLVAPGNSVDVGGLRIEAVPAYNVNKFRMPGVAFHPQADQKVGFIITIGGLRIYHAGDSDNMPGIEKIVKDIDIALVPVSGTYVMTPEEAAAEVAKIKPKVAIPMHYGTIVGTKEDADKFKAKVGSGAEVRILDKE
jgi:L-ascorbate metabolism protein UlaG (beta-lactamase superfamily)